MRCVAVALVSLISAIVAEAPYHLPRPAPHAPSFNFQQGVPRPPPPPPFRPQPQPNFGQGSGYAYQQPSIQPAFVQPAPQYQLPPQPQYQPAPQLQYQPAPQLQYQPAPQIQYQPQPVFQPAPAPLPVSYPQPINIPSGSYGVPQPQVARPSIPQLLPAYIQSQPQPISYNQKYQQSSSQGGYSYSQPLSQSIQATSNLPLQSQALSINSGSSGLSSYQADSNLYNGAQGQVHREALDSVVVDHLQNIIKENEHSTAKQAGYLSLVSGISLENAKPSVEVSSFVHSSPLNSGVGSSSIELVSNEGGVSAPSSGYGLPTITANSQGDSSVAFLPSAKPFSTYGPPN
ncbi:unnamed protein product [Chilo suppressalis]|uniref:Uncharacterized protein n=1 Tax=Chilo suppressalis TaxID=168631 RepID=A0ABN8BB98_CHISP|nr:unnamed protein product [Chilo suppressalis]